MTDETETPDPNAFERFRELTEKVLSVPKTEIDKRAAKDRAKRDSRQDRER
jgi:hypothetical protein